MAVKILHKRSAVEFKSATGAQLEFGELALNYHESGSYLQCKDAAGEIVQLGGVYIGADAPGNELKGAWWLRDTDNTLFLYDGTRWVSIAGGGGGGTGDITEVIGGDGIEATELAGEVTVSVDLANDSHGLSFIGGKLQVDIATTSSLGTVKIGNGIAVDAAGEISVDVDGLDIGVDLGYLPDGNNAGTIENSGGDDAVIPIVTDTVAGLMTGDQKQKLDGIEGGATNQDLSYAAAPDKGTVEITDGTDAVIPIATAADSNALPAPTSGTAGLFTGLEKEKLNGIEPGAQVNNGYSQTESDERYLRVDADAPDQTRIAGEATFSELTTHEGGVDVTGDCLQVLSSSTNTLAAGNTVHIGISNNSICNPVSAPNTDFFQGVRSDINANNEPLKSLAHYVVGNSSNAQDCGAIAGFQVGSQISSLLPANHNVDVKGVVSNVPQYTGTGTGENYNFYAGGNAPSYFQGLTEHEGGVKVTGGSLPTVTSSGFYSVSGGDNVTLRAYATDGNTGAPRVVWSAPGSRIGLMGNPDVKGYAHVSGSMLTSQTDANAYAFWSFPSSINTTPSQNVHLISSRFPGSSKGNLQQIIHFSNHNTNTSISDVYGFRSEIDIGADDRFNFYAAGNAPSYYAGSTYIGGNTTRNTFELWKSTLTEEQLEQLEAGTLVAPANVATPGDGSFARQWWYDQQDAETQTLINSGELEYPEHLAAATFTDTFALGDNTNINLNSNGLGEFKGGVKVTGGNKTTVPFGMSSDGNGFVSLNAEGNEVLLATSYQCTRNLDQHSGLTGSLWYGFDVRGVPELANTTAFNARFTPSTGTLESVQGYQVQGDFSGNVSKRLVGFVSGINDSEITGGGGHALNFLAQGGAANHFSGPIRQYGYDEANYNPQGPVDRSATGTVIDSNHPTANMFLTRNVNDATPCIRFDRGTGNAERRYMDFTVGSNSTIGAIQTTGTNLSISGLAGGPIFRNGFNLDNTDGIIDAVKNVVDRIAAIEANEVIDDATDSSLLQLIASASARLDSIEARLAALEAAQP